MHVAVVGAGLIGAAAARHLAEAGTQVTLVGPDEPLDRAQHSGIFSSHYDQGRITRGLDASAFWARASVESIARYRALEAASGTRFYQEVGALLTGPSDGETVSNIAASAQSLNLAVDVLDDAALAQRFPDFAFDNDTTGIFENRNAGYINPRALVRAQIALATRAGAFVRREQVVGIDEGPSGVILRCASGSISADLVLIAAGGYSNTLLSGALPMKTFARTVAMFRVDATEAHRLRDLPCLIAYDAAGSDPYLLPPIRYPNGQVYLKLGGDPVDQELSGADISDWFRSGGSPSVADLLEAQMRKRMPGLRIEAVEKAPCVTAFTPQDRPIIQTVTDRISVTTAGCGRGAKCSDELGQLGAQVVMGHDLPEWVERQPA